MIEKWNKPGTNEETNEEIAKKGFERLKHDNPKRDLLDLEDQVYIGSQYPKTNDDFRYDEIIQRRIIEGPDVYSKLDFTTDSQRELREQVIEKRSKDASRLWDNYENLVNAESEVQGSVELQDAENILNHLEQSQVSRPRFDLHKGELSLVEQKELQEIIEEIKQKISTMKENDPKIKRYEALADHYANMYEKYSNKYDHLETDPKLN